MYIVCVCVCACACVCIVCSVLPRKFSKDIGREWQGWESWCRLYDIRTRIELITLLASERSVRAQSCSCSIEISDTYVYIYVWPICACSVIHNVGGVKCGPLSKA